MARGKVVLVIGLMLLGIACPCLADEIRYFVGPGAKSSSEAERAIEADPNAGAEHGVYLVHETHADDAYGSSGRFRRHIRAKILSNEARDIANVEIFLGPGSKLSGWWGWTILPDGSVIELEEDQIRTEEIVRTGRFAVRVVKAALPGVVPGAIVDYGYEIIGDQVSGVRHVRLQKHWPTASFRYRWDMGRYRSAAVLTRNTGDIDLKRTDGRHSILLSASDIGAYKDEPMMPQFSRRGAYALMYYTYNQRGAGAKYWEKQATAVDHPTRTNQVETAAKIAAGFEFTPNATLPQKLAAAYDWVLNHVHNPWLKLQQSQNAETGKKHQQSMNVLYLQIARELGAEAHLLFLPQEPGGEWLSGFQRMSQFDGKVIALRDPDPTRDWSVIVDPESGLAFGNVRLSATDSIGFLADPENPRGVTIPPSVATANMTRSIGEIHFSEGGARRDENWTRIAEGQPGWLDVQVVANVEEDELFLELMCGDGSDVDVLSATQDVGYPPLVARLDCEAQTSVGAVAGGLETLERDIGGPWFKALPDLPAGERTQDLQLPFASVDVAEIKVHPPDGFRTHTPPEDTLISSKFGKYQLVVINEGDNYTVSRALALLNPTVSAKDYEAFRSFALSVEDADQLSVEFVRASE